MKDWKLKLKHIEAAMRFIGMCDDPNCKLCKKTKSSILKKYGG